MTSPPRHFAAQTLDVRQGLRSPALMRQWPNLDACLNPRADFESLHPLFHLRRELIIDALLNKYPVGRHTGLPRIAKFREHWNLHRVIKVCVIKYDERPITTKFERELLELLITLLSKELPNAGAPGEADLLDLRAFEKCLPDISNPVHVKTILRETWENPAS